MCLACKLMERGVQSCNAQRLKSSLEPFYTARMVSTSSVNTRQREHWKNPHLSSGAQLRSNLTNKSQLHSVPELTSSQHSWHPGLCFLLFFSAERMFVCTCRKKNMHVCINGGVLSLKCFGFFFFFSVVKLCVKGVCTYILKMSKLF